MTPRVCLAACARRIGSIVLGRDPLQRQRIVGTRLTLGVCVVCALCEVWGAQQGVGNPVLLPWIVAYILAGPFIVYALMRSGLNLRMRQPSLAFGQGLYAISAIVLAYPVNGPARGLTLMLVALPPLLGILALSTRQVLVLGAASVVGFGAMMLTLALAWPERFDPRIEIVHAVLAAGCFPALTMVAVQVCNLRERQRAQTARLQQALVQLQSLATHDELTGLANRGRMRERLGEEAARAQREQQPLCVALIDIDHFKRINDGHGHDAGDQVLRRFAQAASAAVRATDVLARWGGEEFLLLLPGTAPAEAQAVLARVAEAVRGLRPIDAAPALQLRFSAGVALHAPGTEPDTTIARADAALYEAKALGRDRVRLAACEAPPPDAAAALHTSASATSRVG